jgi:pimeloyl-ACP methyl ester carboxylesterase
VSVRDHGGTGPALVLLHGAGADLTVLDALAPLLAATHRTVAVDLRGHGRSGVGPWHWESVLDDLGTAVEALDLDRPAVVGHSVGGLVAARWATRHRDCPAVVSLDGNLSPVGGPRYYDPAGLPLTPDELPAAVEALTDWFESLFTRFEAGMAPDRAAASRAARAAVADDDLASCADLDVPTLLLVAGRSTPQTPPEWEVLFRAYRAGLTRELDALARRRPAVTVRTVDASHDMTREIPAELARHVEAFLVAHDPAIRRMTRSSAHGAPAGDA